jgi:electron-transferring-flavoprotein dehydrogenase
MYKDRETLEFDIVIIGAGPAGLSAAIRLAQLCKQHNHPLTICVLEKGAEVGAHILSGAVLELRALKELLPDWQQLKAPINIAATKDQFRYLTQTKSLPLPVPPPMRNSGNYVISLENLCRWLAQQAEALGIAIFPGFAAVEILYDGNGKVCGVRTGDKGIDKNHHLTDHYLPGTNLLAKQTIFAEGCHGSLTKQLIGKFNLYANSCPQTYGIGIKELWEIPDKLHKPGLVIHTIGWPLDHKTYGGSFIYHADNNQLAVGFVVGLDYTNPYLDPFEEFQRFKTHPSIRQLFQNSHRICYGARALCEGGLQSLPKLTVPGGLIIGDSAGFLNVVKIKGIHTAMKSGMIAAETIFAARSSNIDGELPEYTDNIKNSWVWQELYKARNIRPSFRKGLLPGLTYSAFDNYILRGRAPWTFKNYADYKTLKLANRCKKINYPKPDGKITFDKLSSVYISDTYYDENQPNHLQIKDSKIPIEINLKLYDAPETRYCPTNVYEIIYDAKQQPRLQINATNCVQCKTCDIKDPEQNINWVPPEGGDGPNYMGM